MLKWNSHTSIKAVNATGNWRFFQFKKVILENVYKEIRRLNPRKAAQITDIQISIKR